MIKEKLSITPNQPGCYLMKNKDNVIIYVGKAKDLKKRLSSYFRGTHTGKTEKLVSEIVDFEYIVVTSETESLILELNLIKKHNPKYNILLRDDKSYPYIELTKENAPRLMVIRSLTRKKNKDANLFGPYPNVTAARETVNLLNRIYPLRKCTTYPKKPCLYYHINQCLGYCVYKIEKEKLDEMTKEIISFLKGNTEVVTEKLKQEMLIESEKLNFENAIELKSMIDYIDITLLRQKVEIDDLNPIDIFNFYEEKEHICIQVFFIRGGKIIERHSNILVKVDDTELEIERYIAKFYNKNLLPKEILMPFESKTLEDYLKTTIKTPQKGDKKKLLDMVFDNAKVTLQNEFELIKKDEKKTIIANETLKEVLNLDKLDRIEIFDNSTLFGTYTVSGMVVFNNGTPAKNEYRKYKINERDEYNAMREVIYRRYYKILSEDLIRPDLIIVDGGVGQINVAREILTSLNLKIPVIGLKKNDKHTTDAILASDPIIEIEVDKRSSLFHYLERMQDEVHRYTINYHKQIRSKGSLESILDLVPGIGLKRKKELLKKYKTINKLKELEIYELEEILPSNVAKNLKDILNKEGDL